MKKIKYVVGFMFDKSLRQVVLIRKNKPEWQNGLLNGVGGKVEKDEEPICAMRREFHEEAGVMTATSQWIEYLVLSGDSYEIYFYYTVATVEQFKRTETKTDEVVGIFNISNLTNLTTIYNLQWLIPMALWLLVQDCKVTNLPLRINETAT